MTLFLVGYWKASLDDDYPFPQLVEGDLAPELRHALASYLEAGAPFEHYRGYSSCRYGCGRNGSRELSDGTWVWPEGLAHYVRDHRTVLPSDFVAHATRPFPHEAPVIRDSDRGRAIDDSLWLRWGAAHTSERVVAAIFEGRANLASRVACAKDQAAREQERTEGLSNEGCMSAGCRRLALVGRALCARCLLDLRPFPDRWELEAEELAKIQSALTFSVGA